MFSDELLEKIRTYISREATWEHCLELIQQFRVKVAEMGWHEQPRVLATEDIRREKAISTREEILLLAGILIDQLRDHGHGLDADAMQHWADDYIREADLTNRTDRDLVQDVLVGMAGRYGVVTVT